MEPRLKTHGKVHLPKLHNGGIGFESTLVNSGTVTNSGTEGPCMQVSENRIKPSKATMQTKVHVKWVIFGKLTG